MERSNNFSALFLKQFGFSLVTTHTARRSAATHLALQGVNLKIISDLGGWEKVDTLRTYLRSSGLDSAEVAKNADFFK